MCNAFVDYTEMMNDSGYFYNCYELKYNTLSFCAAINNGAIGHYLNLSNPLKDTTGLYILCSDYNDNLTKIKLNVLIQLNK